MNIFFFLSLSSQALSTRQDSDTSTASSGLRCLQEKMYLPGKIWHLEQTLGDNASAAKLELTVKSAADFQVRRGTKIKYHLGEEQVINETV